MEQVRTSPFQRALEAVEALSTEDQDTLLELIQRRLVERRRTRIATNAAVTLRSVREGHAIYGSVADLQRALSTRP